MAESPRRSIMDPRTIGGVKFSPQWFEGMSTIAIALEHDQKPDDVYELRHPEGGRAIVIFPIRAWERFRAVTDD